MLLASLLEGQKEIEQCKLTHLFQIFLMFAIAIPKKFQFGCTEPGDGVDDTPYMTVNKGCPSTKPDTCLALSGLDPIENFMS